MTAGLPAEVSSEEIRRLQRRLDRERAARIEAEVIAEAGTRRLFEHQRRLELTQAIATASNSMEDPLEAFRFAVERICAHSGFNIGHVWTVDEDSSPASLTSSGIWFTASPPDTAFAQLTTTLRIGRGEGLPGRVLAAGRAIWTEDLTQEPDCPRVETARTSGVRAGFAFPALIGEETVAVLEFFQSRTSAPDEALLEMLDQIAAVLGRVVERHRTALRLKRNNELAAQRDAAEQASKAKSAFLAATSHEVRTPLNAVLGLAQALRREPLTTRQHELTKGILDSGEMLLRLLNSVLDMSKIEAGEATPVLADFDLTEMLRSIVSIWTPRAGELGIDLELEIIGLTPGPVRSDRGRIEQTLVNLVSNAVKFTPPGAAITVRAMPTDGGARLEVLDGGPGVPEADRERIFRPFEQTQEGRSAGGAGLGLSICTGNARVIGGEIGCDRDERGRSRFWFTCALSPGQGDADGSTETVEPAEVRPGLRILAAEDNLANRRVLQALLDPCEVDLTFAEDGAQAIEALRAGRFDCILMDANMPVMDGVEAVRQIRAEDLAGGASIHMLTANVFDEDVARYLSAGADGVLTKPIQLTELFRVLASAPVPARAAA
jgi:signal transduction histidine kinase/ActR/RegA family two-component response regulator